MLGLGCTRDAGHPDPTLHWQEETNVILVWGSALAGGEHDT
jgi:hypothetical protein